MGIFSWLANRRKRREEQHRIYLETALREIDAISKLSGMSHSRILDDIELFAALNGPVSRGDMLTFLREYRELAEMLDGIGKQIEALDPIIAKLQGQTTI